MLNPTDIHYLVGFLSHVGEPDDVELELGSRVPDVAAEGERDVDVTLTRRAGGIIEGFRGIEVKAHKRPLDVEDVEQLCAKLNDMPSLTHRGIVSASGYTDKGRRKAEAHDVELLRIEDWDRERRPFGALKLQKYVRWSARRVTWEVRQCRFQIRWDGGAVPLVAGSKIPITNLEGEKVPIAADTDELARELIRQVVERSKDDDPVVSAAENDVPIEMTYDLRIEPELLVWADKKSGTVCGAHVECVLRWREENQEAQFKILLRDKDESPFGACLLGLLSDGSLVGLAIGATEARPAPFSVSISQRNKQRLWRERWIRVSDGGASS